MSPRSNGVSVDQPAPALPSHHLPASRDRSSCPLARGMSRANRGSCRAHSPTARSGFLPGPTGLRRNPSTNAKPRSGHHGTRPSNGRSAAWWIASPACPGSPWAWTLIVSLGVGSARIEPGRASATALSETHHLGGQRFHPPVFCIVSQASIALWRSILRTTG